jgi:hypothetical protein
LNSELRQCARLLALSTATALFVALIIVQKNKPVIVRSAIQSMTRQQILDLYFLDARSKLIDLAAFLDRVERSEGAEDFRMKTFRAALSELSGKHPDKAQRVLLACSDPTADPVETAPGKGACGAWQGNSSG